MLRAAAAHLADLDATAPGLVVGAHVVGSAVLDDHIPGVSDLDLVCEVTGLPDPGALRPDLDVIYLRPGELTTPVDDASSVAWGRDGVLHTDSRADLTPVLWEQLRTYSRTIRGTAPAPPVTRAEVADWCRANLAVYWQALLRQVPTHPAGIAWVAAGPPRLWHTIGTGRIIGKTQALAPAAERWPDLGGPLGEVAAARRDPSVRLTREHGVAAVELGRRIIGSAGTSATQPTDRIQRRQRS